LGENMLNILHEAIDEFEIIDFVNSDPICRLPADLIECVDNFVEHIKYTIIRKFRRSHGNWVYKKIQEFREAIDNYQKYLANNMESKGEYSVMGTQFMTREEIDDFKNTVDDWQKSIDKIYSELFDGGTLLDN
jgi:chromosome segregation ATPase